MSDTGELVAALPKMWLGPWVHEAVAAYHRARRAGLSPMRALVIGNVASFKNGWAFRKTIARQVGCSVRTVARGLLHGRSEGLVNYARSKKGETAKDERGNRITLPCGFSNRWVIGWGEAGRALKQAISRARANFMARRIVKGEKDAVLAPRKEPRKYTAAELDAELARRPRGQPPPD